MQDAFQDPDIVDGLVDGIASCASTTQATGEQRCGGVRTPDAEVPAPCLEQIRLDARWRHEAAARVWEASGLDVASYRISVCGFFDAGARTLNPVRHFSVGDWEAEAEFVATSTARPGCNMYRGFSIVPADLPPRKRGGKADAVGVFGLAADLDADKNRTPPRIEDLPVLPAMVASTSRPGLGRENLQVTYVFDRMVSISDGERIAAKLCRVVGDDDGGTGDVVHVWRAPGTLNYPKPQKLRRGRSPIPQLVLRDSRGTGRAVAPEQLEAALDQALGDMPAGGRSQKQPRAIARTPPRESSRAGWSGDHFDGDRRELARVVDALGHIPAHDRHVWRQVVCALCDWFRGDETGERLADIWSRGGVFVDARLSMWLGRARRPALLAACWREDGSVVFAGSPDRYDPVDQRRTWQDAAGRSDFTVGTVFHHAKLVGWDASRNAWGLPGRAQQPRPMSAMARSVQAAGQAQPRVSLNLERLAWLLQVHRRCRRPDLLSAAFVACNFINRDTGVGFPGLDRMMRALGWAPPSLERQENQRMERALRDLALFLDHLGR